MIIYRKIALYLVSIKHWYPRSKDNCSVKNKLQFISRYTMQTFEEHTGAYLLLLQEVIQLVDFHG
jgi:hypothetical protein